MGRWWHWVWVSLLVGCGARPLAPVPATRRVVVISLDGFRHDYPERTDTPTLDRLAREGVRATRLTPPSPSLTFPGHASLATGASPVRHGILANRFHDRVRGAYAYEDDPSWYDVDPLWIHSTRLGLRTHVYHWVGSGGARGGVEPAEWRPFAKIPDDKKVAQILAWLQAPAADRPRLIMSYFAGCDHAGHSHGPDSPQVTACVAETDARLGRLVAGLSALADPATLVLVSDHGMTRTTRQVDPRPAFTAIGLAPRIVIGGPVANVYLPAGADPDAAARAAASLPHTTVRRPTGADRHPTRTGDLVLVADFGVQYSMAPASKPMLAGHHGGDPLHPDMGAIFFAWGDGIVPGAPLAAPRAIDVAPTLSALLGIPPPPGAEGEALTRILQRAP